LGQKDLSQDDNLSETYKVNDVCVVTVLALKSAVQIGNREGTVLFIKRLFKIRDIKAVRKSVQHAVVCMAGSDAP
jgi:hypothetical protein